MQSEGRRRAPSYMFPLLAVTQVGLALAFIVYLVAPLPPATDAQVDFELAVLPFSPLLWLVLALVGIVALIAWRSGSWRSAAIVGTSVSGAFGLVGSLIVALGLMALSSYGADFGYPAAPPRPAFAKPVADATGFDDDYPMRGREIVIDIGSHTEPELVDFYRDQFPASEGWGNGSPEADVGGGHSLCLVNNAASGYDDYLEVYPHGARSASGGPHRFLVSLSRLHVVEGRGARTTDRCGLASIWFPSDR